MPTRRSSINVIQAVKIIIAMEMVKKSGGCNLQAKVKKKVKKKVVGYKFEERT